MPKKRDSIEQRIKQYYEKQTLPLDVLVDLKKMIAQPTIDASESEPKPNFLASISPFIKPVLAAAVLLLFFGLGLFTYQAYDTNQKLESVAAEIALNHAKRFDTEFDTSNIASLTTVMHLLDFAPVHPRKMQFETYHIMGARYCTIDSSIAVQVHLEDEAQQAYTLYQFRESNALQIERETIIDVAGIKVTLWKEGEVIMGLAQRVE
ncbi:MAG: hypothetical protein AAF629_30615 [Chloroflexota bacterium]